MYDVIIIGAGVAGSAIARELSKTNRKIAVLEKASDICEGTSKANSGIVHAGYDAEPGSLKAKLNLLGNQKMEGLARELDFPFIRNGSLVLCFDEMDIPKLEELKQRGIINGVNDIQLLNRTNLREMEPQVGDSAIAALYAPTCGIVCPFNLTIALAENANVNGVEFYLNTEAVNIDKRKDYYEIHTRKELFKSKIVINAAGIYADKFHNMVSKNKIHITARKGEYCLMDKEAGNLLSHTVFQLPTKLGKGILVTPTVHGNLLVGPTAEDTNDKEGVNTTGAGLEEALSKAGLSMKQVPARQIITSFAGLRAHEDHGDFIIKEVEDAKGFIDVAGIESPGLTCAPAIGEYVKDLVQEIAPASVKTDFISTRKGIPNMATATMKKKKKLIDQNPLYANVICRCELVTEGEIIDAIHRPLGATTLDGIKRRTRAGMGRCQAGFCSPKIVEILARELEIDMSQITKAGGKSAILKGYNKEAL